MRRKTAYQVLCEVLLNNRHAHLVLKEGSLDKQDQAFVSALVYTTLQHKMYLEYQYADFIDTKTVQPVQIVLLMAACQHYKMRDIPDYALVNESVSLAKKVGLGRYSGLINAVLKKMIQRGERPLVGDALTQVSLRTSMPLWILKLLSGQYSEAFAIDYAQYCQHVKPTYGWVNQLRNGDSRNVFLDEDRGIVDPAVFQSDLLETGVLVIQDINSQRVVDSFEVKDGDHILDCCCAPGTKTLRLANRLNNTGRIVGIDVHESRVEKTKDLMKRAGVLNADIRLGDARNIVLDEQFDVVLIDAPCSGLGVLAHKHDLRYHIKPEDLDALQILQRDILAHCSKHVKKGGLLVYATCTLNRKENERQIEQFIANNPHFSVEYDHVYDPLETQGDGFYVAHLRRA